MSVSASIQNIAKVETSDLGDHGGVLRFSDEHGNSANIFMPAETAKAIALVYHGAEFDRITQASS